MSDLLWELQGELGNSHVYESDGDHRTPPQVALGQVAAELPLVPGNESCEIVHIVQVDSREGNPDSALGAVGVEARVGERIAGVNVQPVSRGRRRR